MIKWVPVAAVLAIVLVAWSSLSFGQADLAADIRQTAALVKDNPGNQPNRVRLASLYYMQGSAQAKSGNRQGALDSFRTGLSTAEEREQAVPHTHPVYQALWYGLGFSYRAVGQHERAIGALDPLSRTFPRLLKGRYLLGVTLLESGIAPNVRRGFEVLSQLAAEDKGAMGQMARRTALRWASNYGTVLMNQGRAAEAARIMLSLNPTGSAEGLATPEEKQQWLYAAGIFKLHGGDTTAGIADLEVLNDLNADYKLRNGITLRVVLANAYYQGGMEQLSNSGAEALKLSVELFDLAEKTGNPKAADVNYGKAVAYLKMGKGQEANVARELALVAQKDPDLYRRVNQSR